MYRMSSSSISLATATRQGGDLNIAYNDSTDLEGYDGSAEVKREALDAAASGQLYGRDSELQLLMQAFQQSASSSRPSQILFLAGCKGTGKTSLGQQFGTLSASSGYHTSVTFSSVLSYSQRSQPPSTTASPSSPQQHHGQAKTQQFPSQEASSWSPALVNLVDQILKQDYERDLVRAAILGAIDFDEVLGLSTWIPNLGELVQVVTDSDDDATSQDERRRRRRRYSIHSLISCLLECVVTVTRRPLSLFLDNLHHATKQSIQLVESLKTRRGIFMLVSYRPEEVSWDSPFQQRLMGPATASRHQHAAVAAAVQSVSRYQDALFMELRDLTQSDAHALVHSMVQSLLELEEEECSVDLHQLSQLVFQKTQGNPYYIAEYLNLLYTRQLLSSSSNIDTARIQAETNVTDNVIRNVSIQRIHPLVQDVLKLAACLGFSFSASLLTKIAVTELVSLQRQIPAQESDSSNPMTLVPDEESARTKIDLVFKIAVEEQLLESAGLDDANGLKYKFTHPRLRKSLWLLVAPHKKPFLHLRIGRHLRSIMEDDNDKRNNDSLTFVVVDQFNRATQFFTTPEDQLDLIRLNCKAGRLALSEKQRRKALKFIQLAARMVAKWNIWKHDARLGLDVYLELAKQESYDGQFDATEGHFNILMTRGSPQDVRQLQLWRLQHLEVVQVQHYGSILDLGLFLLEHCTNMEERLVLPRKPHKPDNLKEFLSVALLKRRTAPILELEPLQHQQELSTAAVDNVLYALQLLRFTTIMAALQNDDELFVLLSLKSMALTLKYGLSSCTSSTVAAHAVVMALRGQNDERTRLGQLALELHARESAATATNDGAARQQQDDKVCLLLLICLFVSHWKESIWTQMDLLDEAYRTGLATEQYFLASAALSAKLEVALVVGTSLAELEKQSATLTQLCQEYSIESTQKFSSPMHKTISHLASGSEVISVQWSLDDGSGHHHFVTFYCQILQAFFFHDWCAVIEAYEELLSQDPHFRKSGGIEKLHFLYPPLLCHVGVAYVASLTASTFGHSSRHAKKLLKELSHLEEDGQPNVVVACKAILQAEHDAAASWTDESASFAVGAYERAILLCREFKFVHYEAFCAERAGLCLRGEEMDNEANSSSYYLRNAHSLYMQWGALGKAAAVEKILNSLSPLADDDGAVVDG